MAAPRLMATRLYSEVRYGPGMFCGLRCDETYQDYGLVNFR